MMWRVVYENGKSITSNDMAYKNLPDRDKITKIQLKKDGAPFLFDVDIPENAIAIYRKRNHRSMSGNAKKIEYIIGWQKDDNGSFLKIEYGPIIRVSMGNKIDWELFGWENGNENLYS